MDERRLREELPSVLEFLGTVASFLDGLDMSRPLELPASALVDLRDGLRRARTCIEGTIARFGEPVPAPAPGIAYGTMGPALRKALPRKLAAQLRSELSAVPAPEVEAVTLFTAFGLHGRINDLLRFVAFLAGEVPRATPPPSPPTRRPAPEPAAPPAPAPSHAAVRDPATIGPDLSVYDIRLDELGERLDDRAVSVWFAASPGAGARRPGLAASFAVPFPRGFALAVADGAEASLGARLAAVVAVRAFCRAAAEKPDDLAGAVRAAQLQLGRLLAMLLAAGDASDAMTLIRGETPPENARRILAHTLHPEESLRRVTPALATSLVGAVAVRTELGVRVSAIRLGATLAEVRTAEAIEPVFGPPRPADPQAIVRPGDAGETALGRMERAPPRLLMRGDAVVLATPAVARGSAGVFSSLTDLSPRFPAKLGDGKALAALLRKAEELGSEDQTRFAGALGLALLAVR